MARHIRISIRARHDDGPMPRRGVLRHKASEAERLRAAAALLCFAVVAGGFATYLFLKPDPPAHWPRTTAQILQNAGKAGHHLVGWKDRAGGRRTAWVDKCSLYRDHSSLRIAYNPDSGNRDEQAQSVCGPFNLVASSTIAVVAGVPGMWLLWQGASRRLR